MQNLEPSDAHRLRAAQGWAELGLRAEAEAELDSLAPATQRHPEVLGLRWTLRAQDGRWDAALEVARELLRGTPEHELSWLHHAYALRRARDGGVAQAAEALKPAAEKFPAEPVIPFNLACYACQLGKLDEAREWFHRAVEIGGKKKIKFMALADEDLKSLWPEIAEL
ncbi:MAG: tetratricopeptide repeat protein [Pedosphaera sp.]|nr:tetratricopeptide repeat protein [Pedosphaera sp.]